MSEAAAIAPQALEWRTRHGPVPYQQALGEMQARAAAIRAGTAPELVWLLEHPPLYTAGTSARAQDLHAPDRFPIFDAGRGGQWTYHGPGQIVGYVLLDLNRRHGSVPARDVRGFVAGLEEWLIRTAAAFGVTAGRREGRVGIWVADRATGADAKLGAIGVRVRQWVSFHGVSLNVAPDLSHYEGIVPCGISAHGVTSLRALGVGDGIDAVEAAMRAAWADVFGG